MFKKIMNMLVRAKIYAQRALGYVQIANFAMILFLTLSNLEKYGMDINLKRWVIPLVLLSIFAIITFGFIDDKMGVFREETREMTNRNPQIVEMLERIKNIEEKLDR